MTPTRNDLDTVVLSCKKCGRIIERPSSKVGVLFSCAQCDTVQKTPGIALQQQATTMQLAFIQRALKRHRVALLVSLPVLAFFMAVALILMGSPFFPSSVPPLLSRAFFLLGLANLGAMIFLLIAEDDCIRCLAGGRGVSFGLMLLCWPAWIIRSVISYVRLRSALARLASAGPRPIPAVEVRGDAGGASTAT